MFLFKQYNKPMDDPSSAKQTDYLTYYKSLPTTVVYSSNSEYRDCIRKVFRFDLETLYTYDNKLVPYDELDEISKDEVTFDSKNMSNHMNILFDHTKEVPLFKEMYKAAAGRMMSESPHIGQAILCSYDTFAWYYSCVWYFLKYDAVAASKSVEYHNLKKYYNV